MGGLKWKYLALSLIFILMALSAIPKVESTEQAKSHNKTNKTKPTPKPRARFSKKAFGKNWCYSHPECDQKAVISGWMGLDCSYGESQSPINIKTSALVTSETGMGGKLKAKNLEMTEEHLENFAITKFQLTNTGSGIVLNDFTSQTGILPNFTWPDTLDSFYKLDRVDLHWGRNSSRGTEHTVDGKYHSAEVQLVFYKSNEVPEMDGFASLKDAVEADDADSLAIMSILLQGMKGLRGGSILEPIISNLEKVQEKDAKVTVNEDLNFKDILEKQDFAYSYMGSLTNPPCNEIVAWLILTEPLIVREEDLEKLRKGVKELDEPLLDNWRYKQDGRKKAFRPVKRIKLKKDPDSHELH